MPWRSAGVRSISTAPMFSLWRCNVVVPGTGTTQGLRARSQTKCALGRSGVLLRGNAGQEPASARFPGSGPDAPSGQSKVPGAR